MSTSEKEAKLPQWAEAKIADLRRKLATAERTLAEQCAQLDEYASRQGVACMTLEPYRASDPNRNARGQVFPIQTHVRVKARADSPPRTTIDVRVTDEGFVEVSAVDGQIVVLPSGGQNVVRIATDTDYEMARHRGLQDWERRVSADQAKFREEQKTAKAAARRI